MVYALDHEAHLHPRALELSLDGQEDAAIVFRGRWGGGLNVVARVLMASGLILAVQQRLGYPIRRKHNVDAIEIDLGADDERAEEIEGFAPVLGIDDPDDLRRVCFGVEKWL